MNVAEAAGFWGVSKDQLKDLIENGYPLPISKRVVKLEANEVPGDYQITEEQLDRFIERFEEEEPGRYPPTVVRRELLTESRHLCGICRQSAPRLEFHHMLAWERVKHHDSRHMLALCANCHTKCTIGMIDSKAQEIYKAKLQEPAYEPNEGSVGAKVKRERDLKTLHTLFTQLPRNVVDAFFEEAAYRYMLYSFITHYWERFAAVLGHAGFHLYDTTADRLLREFARPVSHMVAIASDWMHPVASGLKLTFSSTMDNLSRPEFHQAIDDYPERCSQAESAWRQLYTYIRENYWELDFDKIDAAALEGYRRSYSRGTDIT